MKKYIILILFLLSACGPKPAVKLGFLGVLSGKLGDLGQSGRDGAVIAVHEINEAGGINGRTVELLVEDNQLDDRICREKAELLIDSGISALIGPMTSDMSIACLPLFNKAEIPMISPTASTPKLSGIDDYFLRVNPADDSEGKELARYAAESLDSSRVAVIYDMLNSSFTEGVYMQFKTSLDSIKKTEIRPFPFKSDDLPDFSGLVDSVLDMNPDTVLIIASSVDTGTICQQINKTGKKVYILATGWAMTDELIRQGGTGVEGIVFNHYHNNNSTAAAYLEFAGRFRSRYNREPDFISVLGYNAVMVWARALLTAQDAGSVKQKITEIGVFEGLQGEISIDQYGDAQLERHYITVKDGVFVDL